MAGCFPSLLALLVLVTSEARASIQDSGIPAGASYISALAGNSPGTTINPTMPVILTGYTRIFSGGATTAGMKVLVQKADKPNQGGDPHGWMGMLGPYGDVLEVNIEFIPLPPFDLTSVYLLAVLDSCHTQARVVLGPDDYDQGHGKGPMGMQGFGAGGYGTMMGYGGPDPKDFGVLAELTIQSGPNTFKITGISPWSDINQLAGRSIGLCVDIKIAADGTPVCFQTGPVCVNLGYAGGTFDLVVTVLPPPGR